MLRLPTAAAARVRSGAVVRAELGTELQEGMPVRERLHRLLEEVPEVGHATLLSSSVTGTSRTSASRVNRDAFGLRMPISHWQTVGAETSISRAKSTTRFFSFFRRRLMNCASGGNEWATTETTLGQR